MYKARPTPAAGIPGWQEHPDPKDAGGLRDDQGASQRAGPAGVRANTICPGFMQAHFARVLIETEDIYKSAIHNVALRRHAQPIEVAGLALYLASDAGSFTKGGVFLCDGGASA